MVLLGRSVSCWRYKTMKLDFFWYKWNQMKHHGIWYCNLNIQRIGGLKMLIFMFISYRWNIRYLCKISVIWLAIGIYVVFETSHLVFEVNFPFFSVLFGYSFVFSVLFDDIYGIYETLDEKFCQIIQRDYILFMKH